MVAMLVTSLFVSIFFIYNLLKGYGKVVNVSTLLLQSSSTALLLLSVLHIFIEAQGRYHLMTYPLIALSLGASINYKFPASVVKYFTNK